MNKIAIFYHVYQVGDWQNIFTQQIDRIKKSGLFDAAEFIHIGVNGTLPIFETSEKIKIVRNLNIDHLAEMPTLKSLYNFCSEQCQETDQYNILFLHTSGVSWSAKFQTPEIKSIFDNKTLWRKYQEYFVIDKWRNCISLLNDYDCVSCEWKEEAILGGVEYPELKHYAGNIWWANSEYIKKLDWNFIQKNKNMERWYCEFLIGSGNPNHYSFYTSGRNLYYSPIYDQEFIS